MAHGMEKPLLDGFTRMIGCEEVTLTFPANTVALNQLENSHSMPE